MEEKYSEGNVVWIKLKGYPWWPGIVSMNNKNNTLFFHIDSKIYISTRMHS